MANTILIRVDGSLKEVLQKIQKEVAEKMRREYNIESIKIDGTLASQIAASKMAGNNILRFEIKKIGLNKGIIKLL